MSAHGAKMPVCERRQVIFVREFKAFSAVKVSTVINASNMSNSTMDSADKATSIALKEWFRVTEVKIIRNNSPMMSLKEGKLPVAEEVIKNIHSEVDKAMDQCKCDKIHIIIVAHSHGAKCVNEAFRSFRKSPGEMRHLYNSVAIITFGAIELIKRGDVALTWNYVFKNDNIANKFLALDKNKNDANVKHLGPYERSQACKCCVNLSQPTDNAHHSESAKEKASAFGTVVQDTAAMASVAAGAPSKFVTAHYVTDYIMCKKLQQHLMWLFHIEC